MLHVYMCMFYMCMFICQLYATGLYVHVQCTCTCACACACACACTRVMCMHVHVAAWKRHASGWAAASSGERDSSMRLRWRASRGAAAATSPATARVCTHTPSKPSPAQLAALCSRKASWSQKADASCRGEGSGSCGSCCCGGCCGCCGGVTTCEMDAVNLGCTFACEAAALCTCEAGCCGRCEEVPDRT